MLALDRDTVGVPVPEPGGVRSDLDLGPVQWHFWEWLSRLSGTPRGTATLPFQLSGSCPAALRYL
jgi:hypothetical protein